MTRRDDESGTAIIEFVWLAILLLIPLLYVVLAVFDTQRTSYATSTAGRAFITSPDERTAYARARSAARLAYADQGIAGAPMRLVIRCDPHPDNCLSPGSVVVAEVYSSVDLPLVPDALGGNTPRISVQAVHQAPYGTFREDRP